MSVDDEIVEYPKMVYPGGPNVHFSNAGSGVLVHSAEEEDEVMGEKKPESWDKSKA